MIKSFKGKFAEPIFNRRAAKGFPANVLRAALVKLRMIEAATTLEDLRTPPGNRLEALKGDRKGQYSVRVNDKWRICFVWEGDGAAGVELVDYH